jgi:single-strand DNA-binding protein
MASKSTTKATAPEATAAPAQAEESRVTLVGRLCADPVLRRTKSGKAVTTVRIAVNPPDGAASFHTVVVWNRTAEVVCQYLRKGRGVRVVGREQQRSYETGDGTARTVTEVSAFGVKFLSREELAAATAAPEKEAA